MWLALFCLKEMLKLIYKTLYFLLRCDELHNVVWSRFQ